MPTATVSYSNFTKNSIEDVLVAVRRCRLVACASSHVAVVVRKMNHVVSAVRHSLSAVPAVSHPT